MSGNLTGDPEVFVISEDVALRQRLRGFLGESGTRLVGEAGPGEALEQLAASRRSSDLIFFDAAGRGAEPVRLLLRLRMMRRLQAAHVVAVFDEQSAETLLELLPFGLSGVLRKDISAVEWRGVWPPIKGMMAEFSPVRAALHHLTSAEIYRLHGQEAMVALHQQQAQRLVVGRVGLEGAVAKVIAGGVLALAPGAVTE